MRNADPSRAVHLERHCFCSLDAGDCDDAYGDVRHLGCLAFVPWVAPGCAAAASRGHMFERLASATGCDVRVRGDHRRRSLVNGSDDLGAVDLAQVSGGDGQVGMPELPWITSSEMRSRDISTACACRS